MGNAVQTGRFGRYIQQLFNLNDRLTLTDVGSGVVPSLEVGRPLPEDEIWAGNDLCAGYSVATGDGTGPNGGAVILYNPAGSGRVLVCDRVYATLGTATGSSISINVGNAGLLTGSTEALTKTFRDFRRTPSLTSLPTGKIYNRANGDTTGYVSTFVNQNAGLAAASASGVVFEYLFPIIITPGWGISVTCALVTGAVLCQFNWRERDLGQQELAIT